MKFKLIEALKDVIVKDIIKVALDKLEAHQPGKVKQKATASLQDALDALEGEEPKE